MPRDVYNRIAEELPEGFTVVLRIESGAAWVELELPDPDHPTGKEDIHRDESGMDEIMLAAMERAKELAGSAVPYGVPAEPESQQQSLEREHGRRLVLAPHGEGSAGDRASDQRHGVPGGAGRGLHAPRGAAESDAGPAGGNADGSGHHTGSHHPPHEGRGRGGAARPELGEQRGAAGHEDGGLRGADERDPGPAPGPGGAGELPAVAGAAEATDAAVEHRRPAGLSAPVATSETVNKGGR